MPRAKSAVKAAAPRHDPLHVQLREDELRERFGHVSSPGRGKASAKGKGKDRLVDEDGLEDGGDGRAGRREGYVDPRLSRRILELAREQQDELEATEELELEDEDEEDDDERPSMTRPRTMGGPEEDSEEEDEVAEEIEEYEELEIDPHDQSLLDRFLPSAAAAKGGRTLADLIMEKIESADAAGANGGGAATFNVGDAGEEGRNGGMMLPPGMSPKVVEVYTKVGQLLSRYKSGKLPKAFKIIPSLPNWEDVLYLTDPPSWTPHATFEATKIFVSNLKAKQSQRFFQLVLLDKIRDEIQDEGKASYHTYAAIKKALYKPAAFFKGILFPLCESGTCTLKEAAIVGSVLTKVSVPVLHSAAALMRLADMDYTGPNSLFIRVLLDKKYALPFKVVDALVFHFLRFAKDERKMPVLWHQSLLVFSQRYKQDLTPDQKSALLDLLKHQKHDGIGPEIRRELVNSVARGEMLPDADMMDV